MSDKTKDTEEKAKEATEEVDPTTSWGKFMDQRDNPESSSYFVDGLLSQTDPQLKNQLLEDYKRLHNVVDIFNGLMSQIMATPGGREQFMKEAEKFIQRQQAAEESQED